jgi:hypothetical protein
MSQSQAATERMLEDHAKTMTWADITLGMTRKQIEEHEKELAATARRETEMENNYMRMVTRSIQGKAKKMTARQPRRHEGQPGRHGVQHSERR